MFKNLSKLIVILNFVFFILTPRLFAQSRPLQYDAVLIQRLSKIILRTFQANKITTLQCMTFLPGPRFDDSQTLTDVSLEFTAVNGFFGIKATATRRLSVSPSVFNYPDFSASTTYTELPLFDAKKLNSDDFTYVNLKLSNRQVRSVLKDMRNNGEFVSDQDIKFALEMACRVMAMSSKPSELN